MCAIRLESCPVCGSADLPVARQLGCCALCLRDHYPIVQNQVAAAHAATRAEFRLPARPPRSPSGVQCVLCSNECLIGEGERGFCGLREVRAGKLLHRAGTPDRGLLHWYRDPLPTNCVADWVCEGSKHPGDHNLAVFYASCTANCLFCQNWHFRQVSVLKSKTMRADELAAVANKRTFCVCFFGGDPSSQMPHALAASKRLAERNVRVCWETNGMMHPRLLEAALRYSLETGGCIKFDLKAFDESLHRGLTGVSKRRTLENFARAARRFRERPDPPLVVASTLLVPGYIDAGQVEKIASFIASFDARIPYSLLAFAPNFYMPDLPCTSWRQASNGAAAASAAGLTNVRLGNRHLLGLNWV